jgi:KDO2-lipid IV(A) lauroyltransferase
MQAISYYLALPLIYFISILPFPLLYGFSHFVYLLLYHVLGYRKKVVYENLKNSFPEKTDKEIRMLRRRYYRYLCDLFTETFKTLTIRPSTMLKHCRLKPEADALLKSLYAEHKHIILVMGHFGNWEWAGNTFSLTQKHQLYVIYHPLKNNYFNRLIVKMRMRFGTRLIHMKDTMRDMLQHRDGPLCATAFIADQTPHPERAHWMEFMHQDTPVFLGTEKFSRKFNYPVVYVSIQRIRRGYYEIGAELLFKEPNAAKELEITETHTHRLEQDIRMIPETWLWSHRRWKHKRPAVPDKQPGA